MTDVAAERVDDLSELERQFTADACAEDASCPRCHSPFGCDDELEPSIFCHNCAHEVAEGVVPLLVAELRTLREAQRWIPCSERMPEETERVWFSAKGGVNKGEFSGGEFVTPSKFIWNAGEVTHWMHRPLEPARPKPPNAPPALPDAPKGEL